MKRETIGIGILTVTAMILAVAVYFASPMRVQAADAVQSHDFQMVTARIAAGGEGLYVLDNRTGVVTVYTYDMNTRRMIPRASRAMVDIFAGAAR